MIPAQSGEDGTPGDLQDDDVGFSDLVKVVLAGGALIGAPPASKSRLGEPPTGRGRLTRYR